MKPYSRSVLGLFDGKRRYVIPLFQRQYVWQEERQLQPLWEDIVSKALRRLQGQEPRPHFLGAIVLDQLKTFGDQALAHIVIDGQQRLTTFQIFLAAFRDFAKASGNTKYYEEASAYLTNTGILEDRAIEKYKVWPTKIDQPQYQTCIDSNSFEKVKRAWKTDQSWKSTGIKPFIIGAYIYFYERLQGLKDDPELVSYPLDAKIENLFRALSRDLEIVSIELEGDDDAQVIFETLNARGEPLLASDLLRNYIFLKAAQNKENAEELYRNYWLRFDTYFWKVQEKQGRLKRPRIDLYFQHLLQASTGDEVNIGRLFAEYKDWIKRETPFKTAEAELGYLGEYASCFERLINAKGDDTLGRFSSVLDVLEVKTIYPLIMFFVADAKVSDGDLANMLVDLESYLVRRLICEYTTKNYNKFFLQVLRDLRKSEVSRSRLQEILKAGMGEPTAWPKNDDFRLAWMTKNAYSHARGGKLHYVFGRLEVSLRSNKSENLLLPKSLTVEHVMPQSWTKTWPLSDGRIVPSSFERLVQGVKESEADERDARLHTIGNLTLLTNALNPAVGNAAYLEKKKEITKHSELALNRYFHHIDMWDVDGITKRGELLFERALDIWPHPGK